MGWLANKRMQVPEYTLFVRNSVLKQNGEADKHICVWGRADRGKRVVCDAHDFYTRTSCMQC